MDQIGDDPDALQHGIERASRLASIVGDQTTYQRLKQFVEELKQNLQRRLAAQRSKEAIRARAQESFWKPVAAPAQSGLGILVEGRRGIAGSQHPTSPTAGKTSCERPAPATLTTVLIARQCGQDRHLEGMTWAQC